VPHATLQCIGVPNDLEVDLEVYFKKSLTEDDSEWERSHRGIIDTKAKKGQIWRCLPNSGQFNYVHIDFEGTGGFAHIIEDARKYNEYKALEVLGGAMGLEFVNLTIPMRREKAESQAREVRKRYYKYDWTRALKK
jgi:hypothetical protein